jgi:hypothetical protein
MHVARTLYTLGAQQWEHNNPYFISLTDARFVVLCRYLVKPKNRAAHMVLLVLDEVDQLETRDKSVLYKVIRPTLARERAHTHTHTHTHSCIPIAPCSCSWAHATTLLLRRCLSGRSALVRTSC